ncbi:MAG: hypothetical protein AAF533_00635 [Acidobacteriota bacterium]
MIRLSPLSTSLLVFALLGPAVSGTRAQLLPTSTASCVLPPVEGPDGPPSDDCCLYLGGLLLDMTGDDGLPDGHPCLGSRRGIRGPVPSPGWIRSTTDRRSW